MLSVEQERFISSRLSMKILMNGFLHPFCHPIHRSFCSQGLPGVAESTFQKAKENLLPGEKVPFRADDESEKVFLSVFHPPSGTVPLLPEGEGYFSDDGFCDFAFRLRAE